jgi:hypothetical protein
MHDGDAKTSHDSWYILDGITGRRAGPKRGILGDEAYSSRRFAPPRSA